MALWLKALIALSKDSGLIPNIPIIANSNLKIQSQGADDLF